MTITESTTVAEIVSTLPSSVRVLQRHGVDFCCGGKRLLADVCRDQGLSFPDLTAAIDASAAAAVPDQQDLAREPLHTLVDHILTTYHDRLRADLPRLEGMASKALKAHISKAPYFAGVHDAILELSADLGEHMRKEEQILFPAICALERGERRHAAWIQQSITDLEQEHQGAGELLAELRRLTHNHVLPEWACATVRALYQGLEELEASMHVHVHLENYVLFPRAQELAEHTASLWERDRRSRH